MIKIKYLKEVILTPLIVLVGKHTSKPFNLDKNSKFEVLKHRTIFYSNLCTSSIQEPGYSANIETENDSAGDSSIDGTLETLSRPQWKWNKSQISVSLRQKREARFSNVNSDRERNRKEGFGSIASGNFSLQIRKR